MILAALNVHTDQPPATTAFLIIGCVAFGLFAIHGVLSILHDFRDWLDRRALLYGAGDVILYDQDEGLPAPDDYVPAASRLMGYR